MYRPIYAILITVLILTGCNKSDRSSANSGNYLQTTTQKPSSLTLTGEGVQTEETNSSIPASSESTLTIQSSITLTAGQTLTLHLSVRYPDGSEEEIQNGITYTSDDSTIATVDSEGRITAHQAGRTRIHAYYQEEEAILDLEVLPAATATALTITSLATRLEAGKTLPLQASLTMSDHTTQNATTLVTWHTQQSTVCSIDSSGILQAKEPGICTVTAHYQTLESNLTIDIVTPVTKVPYECPADTGSEEKFVDRFITQEYADINYSNDLIFANLNVTEIEDLFNRARAVDPSINQPMVLPPQEIWDSYDAAQKTLYLVNAARCARGIRPLEGIDPTLTQKVTRPYALFLSAHENLYLSAPHTADGKSPQERMAEIGIILGSNAEYYGENIAMIGIARGNQAQPLYNPEVKAVYAWLYQDKSEAYGHRKTLLHTAMREDSGKSGIEGLLGAYTAEVQYEENGFYVTHAYTVMDLFDPTAKWDHDLSQTIRVPLYRSKLP